MYLYSVTKQQQEEHIYDHVGFRVVTSRDNTFLSKNPTYNEGACFTNRRITNDDPVYEIPQPKKVSTDNFKVIENPAYDTTINSTYDEVILPTDDSGEEDYEYMHPQPRQTNVDIIKAVGNPAYAGTKMSSTNSVHDKGTFSNAANEDSECHYVTNPQSIT